MNKKSLLLLVLSSSFIGFSAQAKPEGEPRGNKGERPSLMELFEKFDSDESGTLSADEVKGPLLKQFDKIDSNADGELTKKELIRAHKERAKREKAEKEAAIEKSKKGKGPQRGGPNLREADTNEDGSISKEEATEAGLEKLLEHFDKIDANEDGELSREELQAMRKARGGKERKGHQIED